MGFKIVYDKKNCIGAGTCTALSKEFWTMGKDGKATLKGGKEHNGVVELEIDDAHYKLESNVAASCPAGCIKVQRT